jgi:serine protease
MRAARNLLLVLPLLVAACDRASDPVAPGAVDITGSALVSPGTSQDASFIVFFDDSVANPAALAAQLAAANGATISYTYGTVVKGFAARMSIAAAEALSLTPRVRLVEADGIVTTASETQSSATWGIDRIDQRALPLSSSYTYNFTGAGVTVYIMDTGIRYDHNEFRTSTIDATSRAVAGFDAIGDGQNGADCHGHGTHVSGTVGGLTYGVAKGVRLVSVRVLNCQGSGTSAGVIAGIDWAGSNHAAGTPAAANMSLGGGKSTALNDAVTRAVNDGIVMAVAAGNSSADACNYSPSSTPDAITAGATGSNDARASFSNWGTCVDLFAPGVSITSSYYTSQTAAAMMSGTSMASPHVAGAAALYLQAYPTATPAVVRQGLYDLTTKGIVTSSLTANNHLLYTLEIGNGSPPPEPQPPSADAITLNVKLRIKGTAKIDLAWSGSTAASIDVFRNGTRIATVSNTGAYTDNLGRKTGSYTHKVCNAGTSVCSDPVTTVF